MNRPTRLRVMGEDWKIDWDRGEELNAAIHIGETNEYLREVWIMPSDRGSRDAETLVHEMIHVAEQAQSIGLDEDTIKRLARSWTQLMRDNPDVIHYILEKNG